MGAASELAGTTSGKPVGKEGTGVGAEMDIKLPGGGTLGVAGATAKDTPVGVVVRGIDRVSPPRVAPGGCGAAVGPSLAGGLQSSRRES